MKKEITQIVIPLLRFCIVLVLGCGGTKVMVPPKVDLKTYHKIGLIEFTSNSEGNLSGFITHRFLQQIQSAQPGIVVLELRDTDDMYNVVHQGQLGVTALQKLGEKYNLDALFAGHLEVTDVKPKVNIGAFLSSMQVKADVEASLVTRLYETEQGATLWTDSAHGKENVAHVSLISDQPAHFDARDPEQAYGKLANKLVHRVTRDFRVSYVKE